MSTTDRGSDSVPAADVYVSTGHLPPADRVKELVAEAHARFLSNAEGKNSQVYPALARVPSDLFGVCVVGTSGDVYSAGDADHEFTIMSVSKPFIFALVCEVLGPDASSRENRRQRDRAGVQFAGRRSSRFGGRTNPMVNSGAIATTSLVPGEPRRASGRFIHEGLSRFAGRTLAMNDEVLRLGVGDEFSQSEHRPPAAELSAGSTWTRPRRRTSTPGNAR